VIAIDPFYFGESRLPERDYLFAILAACVGERPLGVQAGQVISIARLLKEDRPAGPRPSLFADGPRTSTIALVAASLEWDDIDKVTCRKPLASFEQLIERGTDVSESPELFCFGLLEQFDIVTLVNTCKGTAVTIVDPDEQAWRTFHPRPFITIVPDGPPAQ
jgi:hypothetical protein